jgi:hypothetical protein
MTLEELAAAEDKNLYTFHTQRKWKYLMLHLFSFPPYLSFALSLSLSLSLSLPLSFSIYTTKFSRQNTIASDFLTALKLLFFFPH